MEYNRRSDSSGTDDDLPPSHSGRIMRGVRNGRVATGRAFGRPQPTDVQDLICKLEQDAYTAVLRAFKGQSEAITWAKERLMTDLRKELRISDEQHGEFLGRVQSDDTIRQIQNWRICREEAHGLGSFGPPPEPSPSPAISQSRKRHKPAQASQPAFPPPPAPRSMPAPVPSSNPAAAAPRRGVPIGHRGRKNKGARQPPTVAVPNVLAVGGPSTSRSSNLGKRPGPEVNKGVASDLLIDSLIGRRVKTRWPEDNAFYEAVISDYDADTMPKRDLRLVEGPPVSVGGKVSPTVAPAGRGGGGRSTKRSGGARGGLASLTGRARGALKVQTSTEKLATPNSQARLSRGSALVENGLETKELHKAELLPLEDLMKEVDKLEEEDNLGKLEAAKIAAKEHEEAIRKALAEVGESSDEAESDDGCHVPSSHTQSVDHGAGHRDRLDARDHDAASDDEDNTAADERGEGSEGEPMTGEGGGASDADDEQQPEDGDEKEDG